MTTVAEEKNGASAVTRARENPPSRKSAEHYWLKSVFLVTEVPKCECGRCGQRFEVAPPLPRLMPVTRIGWKHTSVTCAGS
jgi:hypothetical protein